MRNAVLKGIAYLVLAAPVFAQAVCLPSPRLLTITPMGGQRGTTVEVTLTGDNFEDVETLTFSHPGITAVPKLDAAGRPVPNQFVVTIAADCPTGLHEACVLARLGVSSSRVFSVGELPEVTRQKPNTSLATALKLEQDSICNAVMTRQAVDYYTFEAAKGDRVVIDCAAITSDSKLKAVLIVGDARGNDLKAERRGGAIDFTAPDDGTYTIKVHDLTFNGGTEYFYRLALQKAAEGEVVARLPATRAVNMVSWPPHGLSETAAATEQEADGPQQITLPCDIAGRFYPAADVDTFEFTAKKGEVWWVEVASERLGRATNPSVIVQQITGEGEAEKVTDVVELTDIDSPVKVSTNGYSYDGPPYNVGSTDVLGKVEIPADGRYRLQLLDLFGGTRTDPGNVYRLIVRQAQPDFAVVGWGLHMELRNGDRNALSKPMALRGGMTLAFEVLAVRRDGFNGPIQLKLDDLPPGVTAAGLTIPPGSSRGILLITADQDAPRGLNFASFSGEAEINGETVSRPGYIASMAWPVINANQDIPNPRLTSRIPVSVCGTEFAPLSVAAAGETIWEAKVGETLKVPLHLVRRSDFSGSKVSMRTFGGGFESMPAFDLSLDQETTEATIDLAKLKTQPGEYTVAFYGCAVVKYRYHPEQVQEAEQGLKAAQDMLAAVTAEAETASQNAQTASPEQKAELEQLAKQTAERRKAAEAAVANADKILKDATAKAAPKDTADILVTPPIRLRVLPAEPPAAKEAQK